MKAYVDKRKVLLVLLENPSIENIEEFEKELITHSHQDLHNRIKVISDIQFSPVQNAFLQVLTNFYVSCRYDRFCFNTAFEKERALLVSFISKHLNRYPPAKPGVLHMRAKPYDTSHASRDVGTA